MFGRWINCRLALDERIQNTLANGLAGLLVRRRYVRGSAEAAYEHEATLLKKFADDRLLAPGLPS